MSTAPPKRGLTRGRTESVKDLLGSQMIRTPEPRYSRTTTVPAAAYFLPGQWRAPLQYVLCVVYRSGSFDVVVVDVVVVGLSYTARSVAGDNAELLACSPLSVPTTYSSSSSRYFVAYKQYPHTIA